MIEKILFTEKYRPQTIEDLVLSERIIGKFSNGVYQNFIFEGPAGTGKTSTAKVLANVFANGEYLYKNSSSDRGIDVIREEITDYCSNMSILSGERTLKVVILDEVDGATDNFFKALRATMERFSKNARFILTCNYINKIPDPIQSRCEIIKFDFTDEEEKDLLKKYARRVMDISRLEGVNIEAPALLDLVKRLFPDFRKSLNYIQALKNEGKEIYTLEDVKKFHGVYKELFELIFITKPNPVENYKYLMENYSTKTDDVLNAFGEDFVDFIVQEHPEAQSHIPAIIVEICEYQSKRSTVIDPVVAMLALVYKLQGIIKGV